MTNAPAPLTPQHLDDLHVVAEVAHRDAVVFERLGRDGLVGEQARGVVVEALAVVRAPRDRALVAFDRDAPAPAGRADAARGRF